MFYSINFIIIRYLLLLTDPGQIAIILIVVDNMSSIFHLCLKIKMLHNSDLIKANVLYGYINKLKS